MSRTPSRRTGIAARASLACFWAAREARRYIIAPREEQVELVGLAELAPLLEALPDPALLIDAEGCIVGQIPGGVVDPVHAIAARSDVVEIRGQPPDRLSLGRLGVERGAEPA